MRHTIYFIAYWLLSYIVMAFDCCAFAIVPTLEETARGYRVTGGAYDALLDKSGTLISLVVNGAEFLAPDRKIIHTRDYLLRPINAAPFAKWFHPRLLTGKVQIQGNRLEAQGEGWSMAYTFEPDAIELEFDGQPAGVEHFCKGYPCGSIIISLRSDLHRVCDPLEQGDLGWPVTGKFEPGDYTVLATNGAAVVFEKAIEITHEVNPHTIPEAPHRVDVLVLYDQSVQSGPIKRRIAVKPKAELAQSIQMKITSPNPNHLFTEDVAVVFPIEVTAHYGHSLIGKVKFEGHNYVWKDRVVTAEVPIEISSNNTKTLVNLAIRPTQPGHYIGKVIVTDGKKPLCAKRVGFVFRPQDVVPVNPPKEFDQFWDDTMEQLSKIPLEMTLVEQFDKETPKGKVFLVKYRSWENRWAWAWLYEPKESDRVAAAVRCPAVSNWQPGFAQMAGGDLRIDVAVHGGDITQRPAKSDFDYMNDGITSRDNAKLRYSYCCLARCYDIIAQHRLCNGTVNVVGASLGAGMSLVLAGLRPASSVKGTAMAMCRIDWTVLGLTKWGPHAPSGSDLKQVAEVIRYYDPACFVHRIQAPLKLHLGLFDFCGPVEGILTAINTLPIDSPCHMVIDPYGGHFTLDIRGREGAEHAVKVPHWLGTEKDNKLTQ